MRRLDLYDFLDSMSLEEKEVLLEDLKAMISVEKNSPPKSNLEEQWVEVKRQMKSLDLEPYIDDQVEIDCIYDICEELIKSGSLEKENWELRKKILAEIVRGEYFDYYGVYDPMKELFGALAVTDQEKLECADLIFSIGSDYMKQDAARLYLQYGRPEKYYDFVESHLGKSEAPYLELIAYYEGINLSKALSIAQLGWEKCKDSQTGIAIFLIKHYNKEKDTEMARKYMKSAKARRSINFEKVLEAVTDTEHESAERSEIQ